MSISIVIYAFAIFLFAGLIGLAVILRERGRYRPLLPPRPPHWASEQDTRIRGLFAGNAPSREAYHELFRYFVSSFVHYRTKMGAGARFPGEPSKAGRKSDDFEGFARLAPLFAAWLAGGRSDHVTTFDGKSVSVLELLRRGLLTGTDRASPEYWGDIVDYDQRMVEAADVARSIWIARNRLWPVLTETERTQVIMWLSLANGRKVRKNNWLLFPVLINFVIESLGGTIAGNQSEANYLEFKPFYIGQGWYTDGDGQKFDYYNAWGIHYDLFWIDQISPDFDRTFIREALAEFCKTYVNFFTPSGFPILGRSICYRIAAPAPLIAAARAVPGESGISPGLARRCLDATWSHFIANGALKDGIITQGYFGKDLRLLDSYSGPASSLWSLRAWIIALTATDEEPLWQNEPKERLPVEVGDFRIQIAANGWLVEGDRRDQVVTITNPRALEPVKPLQEISFRDRILELVLGRPRRPDNNRAMYHLPTYNSTGKLFNNDVTPSV